MRIINGVRKDEGGTPERKQGSLRSVAGGEEEEEEVGFIARNLALVRSAQGKSSVVLLIK